jgi:hypothetical protein
VLVGNERRFGKEDVWEKEKVGKEGGRVSSFIQDLEERQFSRFLEKHVAQNGPEMKSEGMS